MAMLKFTKVRYKNFLSTGNNFIEINLNRTRTTLISGANGHGKSTLADAICYGLFNKSYRKCNKPALVNSINEKECVVEVEFTIGKKKYLVRRGMKPHVFEIYCDGALINQDSKAKDYQNMLERNILKMNYQSFTQIVLLGTSNYVPFMKLSASDRRHIVEEILDLNIFSIMNNVMKQRIVAIKDQKQQIEYDKKLCKEKIQLQKEYSLKQKKELETKIQELKTDIQTSKKEITETQNRIKELRKQYDALQIEVDEINKKLNKYKGLDKNKYAISSQIDRINKSLSFYENNENCPTCKQDIGKNHKQNTIEKLLTQLEEAQTVAQKIEKKIQEEEAVQNEKEKITSKIDLLNKKIWEANTEISNTQQYIEKIDKEIIKIQKKIDKTSKDTNIDELNQELTKLEKEQKKTQEDLHYYDIISLLLKDSGIKSRIIEGYLPIINKLINRYLSVLNFLVSFNLDNQFNETIKSRYRDIFSYANFSEGERTRIDLSLLFTWREVARLRNSISINLLIMDEIIDSSLDENGVEDFFALLQTCGDEVNAFVVSHKNDSVIDKFDRHIKFQKNGNFSQIVD